MSRPHAGLCAVIALAAALITTIGAAPPSLADPNPSTADSMLLYREGFTGPAVSAGDWIPGGKGDQPCLTAGTPGVASAIPACPAAHDASGQGVLRLTASKNDQTGYMLYTKPLAAERGLDVSFDMYQYNTTTAKAGGGADGIAFILVKGTASPAQAGDFGGALGYRHLAGGYLAVGFDQWGNFSTGWIFGNGNGTASRVPNSIVVRGARSTGYQTLVSVQTPRPLGNDKASSRGPAKRHVEIQLSPAGLMSVYVTYGAQRVKEISELNMAGSGQPPLPGTVKFGFAASTGSNTAIHEISGLTITALPPDLLMALRPSGNWQAGGIATLTGVVLDRPAAGPTNGPTTATITAPPELTPKAAGGTGWTCTIAGQTASCQRPDLLQPDHAFPPITVTGTLAPRTPPQLTIPGNAATPGSSAPADGNAAVTVPVAKGPDLSTTITPVGQFLAPGTGTYLLNVANAPASGTVNTPVTETMTVPDGQTPIAATGNGWSCAIAGQAITCQTAAPLPSGGSYPPIAVTVRNRPCQVSPVATVGTPGDTGQPSETAPPVTVTLVPA